MSFLDIFLGGILLFGFFRGIWKGFFVELASFVSLIIGVFVAIKCSYFAKEIIASHVSWSPKTIQITAFTLTFILVVVGIYALGKFFTTVANFASLGILNKLAGGVFGVLKTILMLSIALNIFQKINVNHTFAAKATLEKSMFYFPVQKVAAFIYPSIEDWYKELK